MAGLSGLLLAASAGAGTLAIRGSLENQAQALTVNGDSLLNPQNRLGLANWDNLLTLRMVLSEDVYQSDDAGQRAAYYIKMFGRGESQPVSMPGQEKDFSLFRLDEAYVDYEAGEHVYFLAGKKRVSWGVGFFANPVDAINPLKDVRDPIHSEEGAPVVLGEVVFGAFSLTGIYARAIGPDLATKDNRTGAVAGALLSGMELKFYGFGGDAVKSLLGLSLRRPAGDFVFYGEGAERFGSDRIYFDAQGNPSAKDGPQVSGLLGMSFSFGDSNSAMLEYFYDQRGYDTVEAGNLWTLARRPGRMALLQTQLGNNVLRNYLGASVDFQKLRELWDFSFRGIVSLDQASALLVPAILYRLTDLFTVQLEDQVALGGSGTEYGNLLYRNQVDCYLTLNF
jgi:hypothetical protein